MRTRRRDLVIHAVLLIFLFLTMMPFVFVLNNSLRTNAEQYRAFLGLPEALRDAGRFTFYRMTGHPERIELPVRAAAPGGAPETADGEAEADAEPDPGSAGGGASAWTMRRMEYGEAMDRVGATLTRGYRLAWKDLRGYMLNTLFVSAATTAGVLLLGSISGYVLSRYRFFGRRLLFGGLISLLMIPPVLTLVPSFLLVKALGLLNSYWVLILPYVAGGQIVAIFLFKSFFDGLPEELFESARLEGAGHFRLYWHIVLPLSKQVASVVAVMTTLGVWNNFLWPLVTNTDSKYHVVSSGLYLLSQTATGQNFAAMYAAFVISSLPLVVLFMYATRPFMQGVTSGAFKA